MRAARVFVQPPLTNSLFLPYYIEETHFLVRFKKLRQNAA
jgi:hypothetical protein